MAKKFVNKDMEVMAAGANRLLRFKEVLVLTP